MTVKGGVLCVDPCMVEVRVTMSICPQNNPSSSKTATLVTTHENIGFQEPFFFYHICIFK